MNIKNIVLLIMLTIVVWQIQCTPPSEPDATPPVVTILYPYEGSVISGIVTVSIDASDNGSVARIWYYLDGVKMGQVEESYGQFELDVSAMADDQTHIIYAAAEDRDGNIGHSPQISVIISDSDDIIPPVVQIVNPLDGQVVQDTVLVLAAADDDRIVREVAFFIDGDSAYSDQFYPYEYQWPVIDFADSTEHTVFAKAFDGSGNWAISDQVTVTVFPSLDRTPPSIQLVYPLEGQILFDTVQVRVDASDDKQLDRVEFFVDGNLRLPVNADTASSPFIYNWDTTPYEHNSQHSLYAKAFDKAGNQSAFAPVTYTVSTTGSDDIIPPTAEIIYPVPGSTITDATVTIIVDAEDNVGVIQADFYIDGAFKSSDFSEPWSYNWNTVPYADDGEHSVFVKVFDKAGNYGNTENATYIVQAPLLDEIAPTVSLLYPLPEDTLSGTVNVWVDANDNIGVTQVKFYVDGVLSETDVIEPWGFTWDTRPIADGGNHTLYIKAYDLAENIGTAGPFAFIVR